MFLNHIALTVTDREVSASFYGKWFGLTNRVHDDDHLLILANDYGALLALSEGDVPKRPPRTTHFGFQIDSPSDVKTLRISFQEAGVIEAEWQEQGPTRVQILDPDDYRVEVYAF